MKKVEILVMKKSMTRKRRRKVRMDVLSQMEREIRIRKRVHSFCRKTKSNVS